MGFLLLATRADEPPSPRQHRIAPPFQGCKRHRESVRLLKVNMLSGKRVNGSHADLTSPLRGDGFIVYGLKKFQTETLPARISTWQIEPFRGRNQ